MTMQTSEKAHAVRQVPDLESRLKAAFTQIVADNDGGASIGSSADLLRKIIVSGYLDVEDLKEATLEKFFAAHRVFSTLPPNGSAQGFGALSIRFTVQYNLFAGTVNALGCDAQLEQLRGIHRRGELGSFVLTEKGAGVLSGLVVETTATYVSAADPRNYTDAPGFLVTTPTEQAKKVWISQGLVAEHGVVIASLVIDGKNLGPHGFLVRLDGADDAAKGRIVKTDMGGKTAFDSLDNAELAFNGLVVGVDALLSKHAQVTDEGLYVDPATGAPKEKPLSFITIAQRLLSGRLCIADNSVAYVAHALSDARRYAAGREVWVGDNRKQALGTLPYVKEVFDSKAAVARVHLEYLRTLEGEFAQAVNGPQSQREMSRMLQTRISMAKAEAVDWATTAISEVRSKVGSYSLMLDSPFGSANDILYCMRFAEGDTHILQQSIVRDSLRKYLKSPLACAALLLRVVVGCLVVAFRLASPAFLLQHRANVALLSLLVFLSRNTKEMGKLGAWYAAGSRVYNVAKLLSLLEIHSTATRSSANLQAGDLEAFLSEALKVTAAL